MSPNKIELLLRLHVYCQPFHGLPAGQIHSRDMISNFDYFRAHGLLADGVTHTSVLNTPQFVAGMEVANLLTGKGRRLVKALCAIEPEDV